MLDTSKFDGIADKLSPGNKKMLKAIDTNFADFLRKQGKNREETKLNLGDESADILAIPGIEFVNTCSEFSKRGNLTESNFYYQTQMRSIILKQRIYFLAS